MKFRELFGVFFLCTVLFAAVSLSAAPAPRELAIKPDKSIVAPGYDRSHIEVKFLDDADIGLNESQIPFDRSSILLKTAEVGVIFETIASEGGSWRRMSSVAEERMDELRLTAQKNLDRSLADINNYFILTVPDDVETEAWLDLLNSLPDVEIALAMPLAMIPPLTPGNYEPNQGYLNPSTVGLDFLYAWGFPGGTGWPMFGGPIKVFDFEYSWNLAHDDFPFVATWVPSGRTPSDPFSDDNHGTAVLGEMHSLNNGWGTIGAVNQATAHVAPTYLDAVWDIGAAISNVLTGAVPGDVLLFEQQMAGPNYTGVGQDGLIPIEWWLSWYNLIVTAVGNGVHVVEAAGNGREDLDAAIYSTANGGHWPFLPANNSGAIIVGAGAAPGAFGGTDVDRSRLGFSNWGSRVDVQGWGEAVMTTGYGTYFSAEGKNRWYTNSFGGTSSASPIITSAVASLSGVYRDMNSGSNVAPAIIRNILLTTGAPQQSGIYPVSQHIGPRPDLVAAIAALPGPTCCVLRGDYNHSGAIDITDLTDIVDFMFNGGPAAPCADEADVNKSGSIDIADLTYLVDYLFNGGPPPPPC